MARLKGLFQFVGSLGGITAVNSKEGLYVKTKQNISKKRYQLAPEYADFRMNGQYTRITSQVSSAFRQPFLVFSKGVIDTRMYSRMNGVMRRILMCDTVSRKGEFTVAIGISTPEGKRQLLDFEFNKFVSFDSIFRGAYSLDTTNGSITLPLFAPKKSLQLTAGSTHTVLESGILAFNFETNEGHFRQSEPLQLNNSDLPTDIMLPCDLPHGVGFTLVYFLKVSFVQEINGVFYPLSGNDGGVMKIVGVV
jgi:hypothetical protein